jgi:ribonuclease D
VIDTAERLANFLTRLRDADWVAIDTEADSLHAYPEKLCLVQISLEGSDDLIDTLATLELQPLWTELRQHELIFHGADYDLRLLRKAQNFVPERIFDTMLAARLLGYKEFGLSHLVEKLLGVKLEKGAQRADWARRPLTETMAQYARNDTRFLKPVADLLRQQLQDKGRLSWHQETCARLIEDCAEAPVIDTDQVWRIKGSSQLGRPALAVLRELWHWREAEAHRRNTPPYFILSHEAMVGLAVAAIQGQWQEFPFPRSISPRRKTQLEQAVTKGLSLAEPEQPRILQRIFHSPTEAEKRRFEELNRRRDHAAKELAIEPTLIASRATLSLLARDRESQAGDLMQWQRQLLEQPG